MKRLDHNLQFEHKNHFKELDGLRGPAISLVLLVHLGLLGIGWIGVQLFFVLSGYLITKNLLIIENYKSKWYWPYLKKRIVRIVPLYYLFLFISLCFFFDFSSNFWDKVKFLISLPTFTFNYLTFFSDYNSFTGIGHLWSLCVEWQFYIIWPLLITRFKSRKNQILFLIILICPLLRFSLFELLPSSSQPIKLSIININLISQLDSFACGALVANIVSLNLFDKIKIKILLGSLFSLFVIYNIVNFYPFNLSGLQYMQITSFGFEWLLKNNYGFVWGYSVLNISFGIIILGILKFPELFKPLNCRILIYLGKYSYSIYLFHVPILELVYFLKRKHIIESKLISGVIFLFLIYLISYMCWHLYEKHFMKMIKKSI